MYVHFLLNRIVAARVATQLFDPFSSRTGVYQTWQLIDLDSEAKEGKPMSTFAAQGFSLCGGVAGALVIGRGEERDVDDPYLGFNLPDIEGQSSRRFRLDVHWWESRTGAAGSAEAKALFSRPALVLALRCWHDAEMGVDKSAGLFERACKAQPLDVRLPEPHEATRVGWVKVDGDMLPVLGLVLERAKQGHDLYLGVHRFIIELRPDQGKLFWRMISPAGPGSWKAGEGTQKVRLSIGAADAPTHLMTTYRCRVLA